MTNHKLSGDSLIELIKKEIQKEIDKVIEDEVKKASLQVQKRVRKNLAGMSVSLLSHVSFERMRNDVVITIKDEFGGSKK